MAIDGLYLDHAGATLPSKSLMEAFAANMMSNLYGNPHSASASSQLSTSRIEDIRLRVLHFFHADPEDFDVVFVANATAGIKLVMDAFRSSTDGFVYGYHEDAHTSLVGVRETAAASRCLTDRDVEDWFSGSSPFIEGHSGTADGLFAYPAQSNMDGRRLPLSWSARVRDTRLGPGQKIYTLLDAAAMVSTSQLDLSDASKAPDFVVLSFYKIFGFPDLGALLVRKESGNILLRRKYFGGGTVDTVVCKKEQWHASKEQNLHESLEDGTLPFHNIIALDTAMDTHTKLFDSMDRISRHTSVLAKRLYSGLKSLHHYSGKEVCKLYRPESAFCAESQLQGPIVAFNIRNEFGAWVSNTEIEKLATVRSIHIRTGGLCNPGGIATTLGLEPWEMKRNFSAGYRCGNENDIMGGKPTGIIRASLGAMSTKDDVDGFISFIEEFYTETKLPESLPMALVVEKDSSKLYVESLTIYPIKSCGGLDIPPNVDWGVKPEGLAWDREWCLVHQGTGQALSQKRHPRMALIRPYIDFEAGLLRISFLGQLPEGLSDEIHVTLSADPSMYRMPDQFRTFASRVCGDKITAHTYSLNYINNYFSRILEVPCALARFPAGGSGTNGRHSKAHMQKHQRNRNSVTTADNHIPGAFPVPPTPPDSDNEAPRPILLSNESPILAINRSSIDALNAEIAKTGGKLASPSVFRANVVLASSEPAEQQHPYNEDYWSKLTIGVQEFQMLGSCRRCHMICVDQDTAVKDEEPFVTLAKTRRFDGKVFFGSHMCHVPSALPTKEQQYPTIRVGDIVAVRM
jgi:molybdenum cofactor sulfurtransferase